jgi:hypothetical protein
MEMLLQENRQITEEELEYLSPYWRQSIENLYLYKLTEEYEVLEYTPPRE